MCSFIFHEIIVHPEEIKAYMGECFTYFDYNILDIYRVFQSISMEYNLHMRDSNPNSQMQTCVQDVYLQ